MLHVKFEEIRRRVAPILELEDKAQTWPSSDRPHIQLVIVRSPDNVRMIWLLPLSPDRVGEPSQMASAAGMVGRAVLNALVDLARAPNWIVENSARTSYAGYFALQIDAFYEAPALLAESVAEYVQRQLMLNVLFQRVKPELSVTEVSWPVWQSVLALAEQRSTPGSANC